MEKKYRYAESPSPHAPPPHPPQTPDALLAEMLAARAPELLTQLPQMAGRPPVPFWRELFQPPAPDEGRKTVNGGVRWPYAERLIYLGREFLRLDERGRRFVMNAARLRIWWRGDEMLRFQAIVAHHQAYRRMSEEERSLYRKRLMQAAKFCATRQSGRFNPHPQPKGEPNGEY